MFVLTALILIELIYAVTASQTKQNVGSHIKTCLRLSLLTGKGQGVALSTSSAQLQSWVMRTKLQFDIRAGL